MAKRSWLWLFGALSIAAGSCVAVNARAVDDRWDAYRFLIGDWTGEGTGKPGESTGAFSLAPDLQNMVLVRRSVAEYPAANGRPASKHEDLMVITRGEAGKPDRAVYFDSEGHVIQYTVAPTTGGHGLIFTSDAQTGSPRFRLTYSPGKSESVSIKFEIAPPGSPDGFKTYLEGTARRNTVKRAQQQLGSMQAPSRFARDAISIRELATGRSKIRHTFVAVRFADLGV